MKNSKLTKEFIKSQELESTLSRINDAVGGVALYDRHRPKYPMLLLMGCPRSGTTLFMQWLSSLGVFGYPSNLIARFYANPALGCEIQKVLFDLDKENQFLGKKTAGGFESSLGRTQGALEPSEFWYFWRRYFNFKDIHSLSEEEVRKIDRKQLLRELGAMEASMEKPLAMNWHMPFLAELDTNIIFVRIRRDIKSIIRSILKSRVKYAGGRETWWSFKPPSYDAIKDLDPIEQVVAQVASIERCVSCSMNQLEAKWKLEFSYEDFCCSPSAVYQEISERYRSHGVQLKQCSLVKESYEVSCGDVLDKADELKISKYIERYNIDNAN